MLIDAVVRANDCWFCLGESESKSQSLAQKIKLVSVYS